MNNVICDICGTSYPENMENCPVCGCSRDFILEGFDDVLSDTDFTVGRAAESPRKKTREIFDYDEVNQEEAPEMPSEDYDFDDEEAYEEAPRSNTALVVVLLILIVLLLATAGYFFVRYFLPNMSEKPTMVTLPPTTTEVIETEPTATTELTIPCTDLVLPGGKVELGEGGLWLLNVQVYPEDTTDTLTYVSYDESIVTVTEDGTVTAVGEGETTIAITCGIRQILCNVVVDYSLQPETTPEETMPSLEDAAGETQAATEATEAAQETEAPEVVLKLKKTDITIFAIYDSAELILDCDVKPEEIYWFTMDSTVAIVNNGVVTATGSGITRIYGEYDGQRVECIVRCNF